MYPVCEDRVQWWTDPEVVEPQAQQQVRNLASLPLIHDHVAVMPDCHYGIGATVGSVIATRGGVIPAAVGVDIGCGMIAVQTALRADQLPDSLTALREGIERRIPLGAGGANTKTTESADARIAALCAFGDGDRYDTLTRWRAQLGTLGSGNHFIEVCLDETDAVWLVLHSGSRGIGNKLAQSHIKVARRLSDERADVLSDPDLAALYDSSLEFTAYIRDLLWCQAYALANREEMMDRVLTELSFALYGENGHQSALEQRRVNCHHNFTQQETHGGVDVWLTRKGAIQANAGQWGIIPGSMGTRSYIVQGRGNPAAFCSAPHGAGRRMSRGQAKRTFTMADFDREMQGVECRRSAALLDELPSAYKDIDGVMAQSASLVDVRYTLRQIISVKGD